MVPQRTFEVLLCPWLKDTGASAMLGEVCLLVWTGWAESLGPSTTWVGKRPELSLAAQPFDASGGMLYMSFRHLPE